METEEIVAQFVREVRADSVNGGGCVSQLSCHPFLCLLALGLLLLVVMALLSPFEALGWWAGWTKRDLQPMAPLPCPDDDEHRFDYYLVYLTAIGGISAETISKRERNFLEKLEAAFPGNVEDNHGCVSLFRSPTIR